MANQLLDKQPWGLTARPRLVLENTHWKKIKIMALNHSNFYCLPSTERWSALFLFLFFKIGAGNPFCWKVIWKSLERIHIQCIFQDGKVLCKSWTWKFGGKVLKIIKPWKLLKVFCLYKLVSWTPRTKEGVVLARSEDRILILPQIFTQRDGQSCRYCF